MKLFLIIILLASCGANADMTGRVVRVIDGDTVQVLDGNNLVRIRLLGIDAPESAQPYGRRSKTALIALVAQKQVCVKGSEKDTYQRIWGTIYLNEVDINAIQVQTGMAWAYRYKERATNSNYLAMETLAKSNKVGLWAQSDPVEPWRWRKENQH